MQQGKEFAFASLGLRAGPWHSPAWALAARAPISPLFGVGEVPPPTPPADVALQTPNTQSYPPKQCSLLWMVRRGFWGQTRGDVSQTRWGGEWH